MRILSVVLSGDLDVIYPTGVRPHDDASASQNMSTHLCTDYSVSLITSRHISYNPRLVKEADALQEAGFQVRVINVSHRRSRAQLDTRLMEDRRWTLRTVNAERSGARSGMRWLWSSLRQKLGRQLFSLFPQQTRDIAYSRYVRELAALAAAETTDLYIAHNLQALPAAFRAARHRDALLGFDAEDFHRGEFPDDDTSLQKVLTEQVEERYLPACDHLTAASQGIARAYADTLDVRTPEVVLNVFPLHERHGQTPPEALEEEKPPEDVISLYWYSQVIGPDRGLQDAVHALSQLDEHVHLTLRGRWAEGFKETFRGLARRLGVEYRLRVLPPAPPEQLVERAAQHDVGLALEKGKDLNNDLAVSNKLLVYLLAGCPVVATETTGQRRICRDVPAATRLCAIGDPDALAGAVRSFVEDETSLHEAKAAAQTAGEERYNWEAEREKLIASVERVFSVKHEDHPTEGNPIV